MLVLDALPASILSWQGGRLPTKGWQARTDGGKQFGIGN